MHSVAPQLAILFWCDEPAFPPAKLIGNGVVDAEDSNALINELAVQKLTAERPSAN